VQLPHIALPSFFRLAMEILIRLTTLRSRDTSEYVKEGLSGWKSAGKIFVGEKFVGGKSVGGKVGREKNFGEVNVG
jgi:hypothetical protein